MKLFKKIKTTWEYWRMVVAADEHRVFRISLKTAWELASIEHDGVK